MIKSIYASAGGSLTLTLRDEEKKAVNGICALYDVDDIRPYCKKDRPTASRLQALTQKHHITCYKAPVINGVVTFSHLKNGTYLVCQNKTTQGYYPMKSFVVRLPAKRRNGYNYHIKGYPKIEKKTKTVNKKRLPIYDTPKSKEQDKKRTPKTEKKVEVSTSKKVKTSDETIVSVLIGIMLVACITMIVAKFIM